jgi:hypothetical protein
VLVVLTSLEYGLPVDEEELDRIDLKHRLYTILLDEKLFLAPIGSNPQKILDLGTGSGKLPPALL